MARDVVLFIDANQYLNLYRMVAGKRLLDSLEEQKAHIFVSVQIVDEVLRNKLRCAQTFFLDKLKEVDEIKGTIPDHLLGIGDEKMAKYKHDLAQAVKVRTELTALAANALSKISRSADDVSQRLEDLFDKPISATNDEMCRARNRKETGNPPGKKGDPLGDQITWEQLLTYCKGSKRLWIITFDKDFCIRHGDKTLLNPLLNRDLIRACGAELENHCFSDLLEGIQDFGKNAGVKADQLPTEEEAKEIKEEIEALPPLGWLNETTMGGTPLRPLRGRGAFLAYADVMQGVPPPPGKRRLHCE
jgi:hypothetical protein